MSDLSGQKVSASGAALGSMGQRYLTRGEAVSLRLWDEQPGEPIIRPTRREYETVGYVIQGRAELELENERVTLEPGDSWYVPKHAVHRYQIIEPFVAVEATSPPARVDNRDET